MVATRMTLTGDLACGTLVPWILHRGRVLNLSGWVERISDTRIDMALKGPADLVDAMEVACSLGPADVIVDRIVRTEDPTNLLEAGFVEKIAPSP